MNKILLITYYFPPCGGAAVQRWVRFLPGLIKAGYNITVLTTIKGDYPYYDESLLKKIPPEVEIFRTHTPVFGPVWKRLTGKNESLPYGSLSNDRKTGCFKKILFWLRLNIIFPDARIIWNPYASKEAYRLCRMKGFNYVITTGPPHSTHLVGLYLKKRFNLKWIADFRDPWSKIYYLDLEKQSSLVKRINRYLEQKVIKSADLNLVVSKYIADNLPDGNKKVLLNGYNQEDFAGLTYQKTSLFRIKYIGQLTAGQDIAPVIEQVSVFADTNHTKDISVSFIGTKPVNYTMPNVQINYKEHVPHGKAISEMVNSELIILIINNYCGNRGMLTTKLFEYIASGTPILCIGPVFGEAARIIRESASGIVCEKADNETNAFIQELYDKWSEGHPVRNSGQTAQWSVQQQIKELINILS